MSGAASKPVIHPLLASSAQLLVYLSLRRIVDPSRMAALREEHLCWAIGQERAGKLMLAGPTKPSSASIQLDGLMVLRAADAEEALALASQDPYVQAGAMTCEVCAWTIVEGALPFTLRLSDSSVAFA